MAARCLSCGASIVWLKTPKGNWMPANEGLVPYEADPEGPDRVVNQKGEVIRCRLMVRGEPTGTGRIPHWATCPKAEKYRRAK